MHYLTAALYRFVSLSDAAKRRDALQAVCDAQGVKGLLLLAAEGINGTIAGDEGAVRKVLAYLRADPVFAALTHQESWSDKLPFVRMKVRLKKEIVTLGVPGLDPTQLTGHYVKPQDWNALISQPDVVLIDTRNDYEVAIGTFQRAVDPRIQRFADFPQWLQGQEAPGGALEALNGKKPRVAMFCTGGIRCEKSTALLRMRGYDEVYHLAGGILSYLETQPAQTSTWQGECFVFDERVSVGHGLQPGPYALCRSCRRPLSEADTHAPQYIPGVRCAYCCDSTTSHQQAGFAERERQVALARLRGQTHVGARMPSLKREPSH
jgi:UPF0176 protein